MSVASWFALGGALMSAFWVGAFFVVMVLDLAPYHDTLHYRVTSAVNALIFGLFGAFFWLVP